MAFRSTSQFRFEAPKTAEATRRPVCACGTNDQAARDPLNRPSSDTQASISLRIADNRGSAACGSSAAGIVTLSRKSASGLIPSP